MNKTLSYVRLQSALSTGDDSSTSNAPALASPAPAVPGYELGELIGSGGMGEVYRARDVEMDREVAIKILQDRFRDIPLTAARFLEEAKITGQLQHPGIPAVYRVARLADGRPFLAMKLIKGQTLDDRLKSGGPINHLAIIEAVAQAVGYAHAHDVIHRDLKPQNVMVGAFGEIQVMDWGLAKVLRPGGTSAGPLADPDATIAASVIRTARDSDYTQAGSVLGTPSYMPPEQAAGETARIGKASDVFGLGALWCKLLTGQPPFAGPDAESVRRMALRGQTEEALARLEGCGADPEVIALCKRCLAVEPPDRPQDANEVARQVGELRVAAEERARQAELARERAQVQSAEERKRRRVVQWAAALVAAVLLVGVAGTSLGLRRANIARAAAEAAEEVAITKRKAAEAAEKREAEQRRVAEAAQKNAEAAQKNEAQQRRVAVSEAELSKAVKEFLQFDVLQLADPVTQQRQGELLPYDADVRLRDVVLRAAERIEGKFADRPLVEAEIRFTLGHTLNGMSRSDLAVKQLQRVLDIRKSELGTNHLDTLLCMNELAGSYAALGRHADALALNEQTLALRKEHFGTDHGGTLTTMRRLASNYAALGRHADALRLKEETLALQREQRGVNHPDILRSMHSLAVDYMALGRYADGVKLNEETFALQKKRLGPDHPHTLESMHNLAWSYGPVGRHPMPSFS